MTNIDYDYFQLWFLLLITISSHYWIYFYAISEIDFLINLDSVVVFKCVSNHDISVFQNSDVSKICFRLLLVNQSVIKLRDYRLNHSHASSIFTILQCLRSKESFTIIFNGQNQQFWIFLKSNKKFMRNQFGSSKLGILQLEIGDWLDLEHCIKALDQDIFWHKWSIFDSYKNYVFSEIYQRGYSTHTNFEL